MWANDWKIRKDMTDGDSDKEENFTIIYGANCPAVLIENFFNTLNAPLKAFEQRLKNEEESLQNRIATFEENDKNKAELSINLHKNIKKLENIMLNIKGLH
jgi:flagellar motor component MotA